MPPPGRHVERVEHIHRKGHHDKFGKGIVGGQRSGSAIRSDVVVLFARK